MTFSVYINELSSELKNLYPEDEAIAVTYYFIEELLSLSRTEIVFNSQAELTEEQFEKLELNKERLLNGEPVQYVTNCAWFYGLKYYVDKNVLIPRQETEILVDFIIKRHKKSGKINMLDIGTGSGCIPITLKKNLHEPEIFAIDISKTALDVCKKNQALHNVEIFTAEFDILSEKEFPFNYKFDFLISNPPYVLNSEKLLMHKNVVEYEPDSALYVDDLDPLVFYRKILQFADKHSKPNSEIIFEINEKFAKDVILLNEKYCFRNNRIIRDLNNKDRFVFGTR